MRGRGKLGAVDAGCTGWYGAAASDGGTEPFKGGSVVGMGDGEWP